jgi:hypothetical protein
MGKFRIELEELINKNSMENASDTPDFVLAEFLNGCLKAFDKAVNDREKWYGRKAKLSEMKHLLPEP